MRELVDTLRDVLGRGPRMRLAVLFGSFATGRAHPGSDVDLAVLPADAALSLSAETALASDLERATGRTVDLVRLDHAPALLRWQIARDGVLVLAEQPAEWTRFRAVTAAEHADVADSIEASRRLFLRRLRRAAP